MKPDIELTSSRDRATTAFGGRSKVPDWVWALAVECDGTSQKRAGKRLGVSSAMINQALKGAYPGNVERLEIKVRGELMKATCACPILGEISTRKCLDEQSRPWASTNPTRIAVYRACRDGCPHFKGDKA